MSTGDMTEATPMTNMKPGGRRFLDSGLNRMIAWAAALLLISVLGFGVYYYLDQSGSGGTSILERQLVFAEQAVQDDPTNITNRLVLADLYFAEERYEEAVTQYQEALKINDKTTLGQVGLGRALMKTGDYAGATKNFQAVIDLSKDEDISGKLVQSSYYYLGTIALENGNAKDAVKNFKQATTLERSDADAWYMLGKAYQESGELDNAIDTLGQAILFVPNFTEAYETLAEVFDAKDEPSGALYARGMADYSRGDLGDAADKLEASIDGAPRFAAAHAGLGLVRETQGNKDAAIVAYQEALHLEPDNFLASNGLSRLIEAFSGSDPPAGHPTAAATDDSGQGVTP